MINNILTRHTRILFLTLSIVACQDDYMAEHNESIVVEGWIESGEFPVVIVTRSAPVSDKSININQLYDYVVKWAVVSISCGDTTVTLTGKYDNRYFPPFIYTTGNLRGEELKTYTLNIDYKEYHVQAISTIPQAPRIDSLTVGATADNDSTPTLSVCFHDQYKSDNYYQIFVKKGSNSRQYLASYLGCINNTSTPQNHIIPVHQAHQFGNKHYTPYFTSGDTVSVKLARIDRQSYIFWSEYENAITLSGNMMFPYTTNIPSNIVGGLGYWCGMGIDTRHTIITK